MDSWESPDWFHDPEAPSAADPQPAPERHGLAAVRLPRREAEATKAGRARYRHAGQCDDEVVVCSGLSEEDETFRRRFRASWEDAEHANLHPRALARLQFIAGLTVQRPELVEEVCSLMLAHDCDEIRGAGCASLGVLCRLSSAMRRSCGPAAGKVILEVLPSITVDATAQRALDTLGALLRDGACRERLVNETDVIRGLARHCVRPWQDRRLVSAALGLLASIVLHNQAQEQVAHSISQDLPSLVSDGDPAVAGAALQLGILLVSTEPGKPLVVGQEDQVALLGAAAGALRRWLLEPEAGWSWGIGSHPALALEQWWKRNSGSLPPLVSRRLLGRRKFRGGGRNWRT